MTDDDTKRVIAGLQEEYSRAMSGIRWLIIYTDEGTTERALLQDALQNVQTAAQAIVKRLKEGGEHDDGAS